jgi:hypothetical protein
MPHKARRPTVVVFDGELGGLADAANPQRQRGAAEDFHGLVGLEPGSKQLATQRQYRRAGAGGDAGSCAAGRPEILGANGLNVCLWSAR